MNDNFASEELKKFSHDSEQWWDIFGDYATLHAINPLRFHFIHTQTELKDKKVLDIGCGGGILTESLAKAGTKTTGIDLNLTALNAAKAHANHEKLSIEYLLTSAEDYAQKNPAQFDVISCMEMLEHVPKPESIVQACAILLKPHGKVFFSTLNRNLKSYLFSVIGAEYILKLLPKGTHDYAKFIKPHELAAICRETNLNLIASLGIHYNPLTQKYSLTHDLSVNYLMAFEKAL